MMETTVKDRQWAADIALQTSGSMEAAMELCVANNIGLTDVLTDGTTLTTPEVMKAEVAERYRVQQLSPATAWSREEEESLLLEGIEHWGIEFDFTVS